MVSKIDNENKGTKKVEIKKKFYTSYSKLSEVKLITIGLASPERIKQWAEKTLPNGKILGEVMNANTLHHKTFKPQKGGLFCERIFGPLKDFECACGKPFKFKKEDKLKDLKQRLAVPQPLSNFPSPLKGGETKSLLNNSDVADYQPPTIGETAAPNWTASQSVNLNKSILGGQSAETKTKNFCNICEVEYTWSVMRRYQLGYVNLISPVTHVWYLKGNPSYLSILLDMKKRHLEYIAYCSETLTLENGLKGAITSAKSSDIVSSWKKLKHKIKLQRRIEDSSSGELKNLSDWNANRSNEIKKDSIALYKKQLQLNLSTYGLIKNKIIPNLLDSTDSQSVRSYIKDKPNINLARLGYTLCTIKKIEKRENLKLKKFEFWKQFVPGNSQAVGETANPVPAKINNKSADYHPRGGLTASDWTNSQSQQTKISLEGFRQILLKPLMQRATKFNEGHNKGFDSQLHKQKNPASWPSSNILSKVQFNKNLKKYSQGVNLKNLKYLSFLIIKAKEKRLKKINSLSSFNLINIKNDYQPDQLLTDSPASPVGYNIKSNDTSFNRFSVKQIFKKISISSYILLNLNIFSQKSIYNNLINLTWEKLFQEAYKKALNRSNKIINKIDSTKYNQKFLSNQLSSQNFNRRSPTDWLTVQSAFLFGCPNINNKSNGIYDSHQLTVDKEDNFSINLKNVVKKIKKNVYNILNSSISKTLSIKGTISQPKSEPKIVGKIYSNSFSEESKKELFLSLKDKMLFNTNTIELYTLSNFPTSISNFLISNFFLDIVFSQQLKNKYLPDVFPKRLFKIIIKNLTLIFLKLFLKNKSFKYSFWLRSINLVTGSQILKSFPVRTDSIGSPTANRSASLKVSSDSFPKTRADYKPQSETILNKKKFNKIKKSLINFFLIGNLNSLDQKLISLFYYLNKKYKHKQTDRKNLTDFPLHPCKILSDSSDIRINKNLNSEVSNNEKILSNNKAIGQNLTIKTLFTNQISMSKQNIKELNWSNSLKNKIKANFILKNKAKLDVLQLPTDIVMATRIKNIKSNILSFDWTRSLGLPSEQNPRGYTSESADADLKNFISNDFMNLDSQSQTASPVKDFTDSAFETDISRLEWQSVSQWNVKNTQMLKNKIRDNSTKKLYNNIYCLSHRERWQVDNDWNFLYYYITVQNLDLGTGETGLVVSQSNKFYQQEKIVPNYINRFENVYTNFFNTSKSNSLLWEGAESEMLKISTIGDTSRSNLKSTLFSGAGIIQLLLTEFNFFEIKKIDKQNRILLYQLNRQILKLKKRFFTRTSKKELKDAYKKRDLLIRRTKLVRKLFIKESPPQSTILTVLPVLPPDLRPIVKMGSQIAASDLNRLYQRVIYRNDRLKKFLKDPATSNSYEMKYAQRLLQEAVDNLIQNGKSGVPTEKDSRGRALKSLSDILKGKQGRFRQYLLGKRVDYSGRSVIVVGPKLKLHECGIPKEMALELYLPFLLKRILNDNLARTVVGAKMLIKTNHSLVWELLREIMQTCPVLLNRAPTLHRLGIQAFQPKLIEGRAILLHPLVCSAFNADFDGDQMAVHVPITVEARAEAWKLMLSRNSILSHATGDPLAIPSQDMVLGCYYLTTTLLNIKKVGSPLNLSPDTNSLSISNTLALRPDRNLGSGFYFSKIENALKAYELKKISLHANIWLKWTLNGLIDNGCDQEEPLEIRLDSFGNWKEIYNKSQKNYNCKNICLVNYILTTPGKIIFNFAIQKALK